MIHLTVDHRERISGIPDMLIQKGLEVNMAQLGTGDYVLNGEIVVERKSAEDFVQSLISNRLFDQCSRLVKTGLRPLLLLEGDPLQTFHRIRPEAVKGALMSVVTSWQIPVVHTEDRIDSAERLWLLACQQEQAHSFVRKVGNKPKRIKSRRLWLLQGLPNVGAVLAAKLLKHFGNIEAVVCADAKTLRQVPGLGKKTAERIRGFVSGK